MRLFNDYIGNGQIIKSKKDIFIKLPLSLFVCIGAGFSPLIIAFIVAYLTEFFTGQKCLNEGSCFWAAIPWLCLITLPTAGLVGLIILLKSFREIKKLKK